VCAFIGQRGLAPAHVGAIVTLTIGMTRPELARTLVCVGANYRNDDHTRAANALFDPEALERDHPEFVQDLIRFHDAHQGPGYWRTLVGQVRTMLDAEPNYTEEDLRRIPTPALLIAGETDPWGNLDQMHAMRRSISNSEMLILNHAGRDIMSNHVVQYSRADIVSSVVLDFLARHDAAARKE